MGLILFEQLGEEYPDTLGSITAAEGAIANVVGMTQINLPFNDHCKLIFIWPSCQLGACPAIGFFAKFFSIVVLTYSLYQLIVNSCRHESGCAFALSRWNY
jgi:hypothetical protein